MFDDGFGKLEGEKKKERKKDFFGGWRKRVKKTDDLTQKKICRRKTNRSFSNE